MRTSPTSLAVALLGGALALSAQGSDRGPAAGGCEATFDPARVPVSERPATVHATVSDSIEKVTGVRPQDGSGLEVRSVEPVEPDDDAEVDLEITLDTSGARPGEWRMTIEARPVACEGRLAVVAGPERSAPRSRSPGSRLASR